MRARRPETVEVTAGVATAVAGVFAFSTLVGQLDDNDALPYLALQLSLSVLIAVLSFCGAITLNRLLRLALEALAVTYLLISAGTFMTLGYLFIPSALLGVLTAFLSTRTDQAQRRQTH